MNPGLLAALINEIAIPDLTAWLRGLHAGGTPLTDATVVEKLVADANYGEQVAAAWLAAHP